MNRREKLFLSLYLVAPLFVVMLVMAVNGLAFLENNYPIIIGIVALWFLVRLFVAWLYGRVNSTKS